MKLKLFFLPLFLLLLQTSFSQSLMDTLRIKFIGQEYEKLGIRMHMEYGKFAHFKGESTDRVNWTFVYPDSIYEKSDHIDLFKLLPNKATRLLCPRVIENGRTTYLTVIGAVRNVSYVFKYIVPKPTDIKITNPQWYNQTDDFIVENLKPEEYGALYYGYCFFGKRSGDKTLKNYEEMVERYIELTKKFPDNHSFMGLLAGNMKIFDSREDLKSVYDCFSDTQKDSYFGKKVRRYIEGGFFHNSTLPNAKTETQELLVQDSTKYNLIVFSAAWCQPCHKIIPILKQMHKDLKKRLIITYVSIDETKTIDKWKELMVKEQIPWRSLLAKDCLFDIKNQYLVQSIPCMILVHPSNKMEWIDLRREPEKEMVYKLVKRKK